MLRGDALPDPGENTGEDDWRFAVLGPLQAQRGGAYVELGPFKQRVLLAVLLCRANTVLSVDQLLGAVWGDEQPRTARTNLQVYISALRRIVGDRIRHVAYGYSLQVSAAELDLLAFSDLAAAGRASARTGDVDRARVMFGQALKLWRDRPLVDLLANSSVAAEADTLMERYLDVYEDWAELQIGTGRHLGVVEYLQRLAGQHPFRERLVLLLMRALNQGGNRREALAQYEKHRQLMARELGLEPSPVLQRLYRGTLAGEAGQRMPPEAADQPSASVRPAQLPRDLSDFIGRDEQVKMLAERLGRSSGEGDIAVVSGHTGTGKTALAVHLGHLLAGKFADGNLFVMLRDEAGRPRLWRDVLGELMRSTGLQASLPGEEAAALGLWRSWVADRRFLFVLDDAPDEALVRRLLPGRGASVTIVTSHRTLGGLESVCRIHLGEFSHAEAQELLRRALGEARGAHASDDVRRIIARCGGEPLVIRLVAAKLTVLRHLSLRGFADHLDRVADVLGELAISDMSVRVRLERCYRGLPPHQREAFARLGSLAKSPFGQDEALAVLGGLPEPAGRVFEELIDANLIGAVADQEVTAHSVAYAMPRPAYLYAAGLVS
jgi:DNA-binding SARP family transcriptional activator